MLLNTALNIQTKNRAINVSGKFTGGEYELHVSRFFDGHS